MYVDLLEEAELGRIYTANFDEDLSYDLIHNGFSWDHTEGMITALNTNPGCIRSDNHMAGTTGTLELYVYSQSSPTIISFWAMLQAGGNNKGSFWIDGVKMMEISGGEFQTEDWSQYTFELSEYSSHTLEWKYTKNDNTSVWCRRFPHRRHHNL